ncbi:hypothetical protein Avbf_10022 [Armadillidium vulgare]|nr:hypothetical protein Avbf_10022 [Armadillidium vulgare]
MILYNEYPSKISEGDADEVRSFIHKTLETNGKYMPYNQLFNPQVLKHLLNGTINELYNQQTRNMENGPNL